MNEPTASAYEILGWLQSGWAVTIPNVAATTQMTIGYRYGGGTVSLYVNDVHDRNLTLPNLGVTWGTAVFTGLTIPAGAGLRFQQDGGDVQGVDLDYLIVGPVYAISGRVTGTGGAALSGATVYFSRFPDASADPASTTTTDPSGNYSFSVSEGAWYVCASYTGYNTSADQSVTVSGAPRPNINFALVANVPVGGKVTNKSGGAAISGASVYFTRAPGGPIVFTATTNPTGDYLQLVQDGTWYVNAYKTGFYPSPEQIVVVGGVAVTGVNIQIAANTLVIPQTNNLYFSVDPYTFTGADGASTGNWQLQYLDGVNVSADPSKFITANGSPKVENRAGLKWKQNRYADEEGFLVEDRTFRPIINFNGGTIVAVVKPVLYNMAAQGYGGQYIVAVGYYSAKSFSLIINNQTGELRVRRNANAYSTNVFLPDGLKAVVSFVVQPDGSLTMYVNGLLAYTQSATSTFLDMDLSTNPGFSKQVWVGRGSGVDGPNTYSGNIGDVLVYKTALSGTDRSQLESDLMKKYAIYAPTITASAGAGGTIDPSGAIVVQPGMDQTFTITPIPGYGIATLTVDGVPVTIVNSYTFHSVTSDHAISATFAAMPDKTITASAGPNGTIDPSGKVSVQYSGSRTFNMIPDPGYTVDTVTVDDVPQGSMSSYTFNNVTVDHTISVTFMAYTGPTPMAFYEFENNVLDSMGAYNGTAFNSPTYVTGKIGTNAIQFNGSNQYVTIPRFVSDDWTFAFWVKTTQTSPTGAQWYSGNGLVDGEVGGVTNDFGTSYLNGKAVFGVGNPDVTIQSTSNINSGSWVHVACTRNGTNGEMKIYVNGALETTATGPTGVKNVPANLHIGNLQTGINYFNGAIDQLKIYNSVLTPVDIAYLANEGLTAYTITASAGVGGTINPSGAVVVMQGADQTFNIAANGGYAVAQVTVDSVNQGEIDSYTFTNVQANHAIAAVFVATDLTPPTPNPATFAISPVAVDDHTITMTATTGSDDNGPVEYYFSETSGNPGGSDSAWQTDPSYTDIGLNPDTQYTYTVKMKDFLGNEGAESTPESAVTAGAPANVGNWRLY